MAGWLFNLLSNIHTPQEFTEVKEKRKHHLNPTHLEYLHSLHDSAQYPAARCGVSENVFMYHLSAVSGGENRNHANENMRSSTAVDLLNVALLLLKMEEDQFEKQRGQAWSEKQGNLTTIGQKMFDEKN